MFSAIGSSLPSSGFVGQPSPPTLEQRAKTTFMALDRFYANSGCQNIEKKEALIEKLLDAGFDINVAFDIDGTQKYLLDVVVGQGDRDLALHLVRDKGATPVLCTSQNQAVHFMEELYQAFNSREHGDVIYVRDAVVADTTVPVATASFVDNLDEMERGVRNSRAGLNGSFFDIDLARPATTTTTTQLSNLATSIEGVCSPFCRVVGPSLAGGVVFGGLSSAASALIGYTGAAILHNYYESYDSLEATRMGAIGGAIVSGSLGAIVGPCILQAGAGTSAVAGGGAIAGAIAGAVINGLIGYGVMNQGSSETAMNLGQTALSFVLGSFTVGTSIVGAACVIGCIGCIAVPMSLVQR